MLQLENSESKSGSPIQVTHINTSLSINSPAFSLRILIFIYFFVLSFQFFNPLPSSVCIFRDCKSK